jgi:ribonucleotide monophosphatase NagD (HAD superfamily)
LTLDSGPFIAAPGLDPSALAKIGDDAHNDLVPAKSLGLTTILVRTGKQVGPALKPSRTSPLMPFLISAHSCSECLVS